MHIRSIAAICVATAALPLLASTSATEAMATGDADSTDSLPFFGVNVSKELTRSIERPGRDAGYDWDSAKPVLTDGLGVDLIRSGLYCASPEVAAGHESFNPFGCSDDNIDEAHLLRQLIGQDGVRVTPLVQIDWRAAETWGTPAGQTEGGRASYYRDFGADIGRTLGLAVASGDVPYFELGNEPDHACVIPGNPWGTSIAHFDEACVHRAATSMLALQDGIRAGVAEVAPGAAPKFAVGSSGIRWGMTDALKQVHHVDWDFTAVHWYYQSGYGAATGAATDQSAGFDRAPVFTGTATQFLNVAEHNRDAYGKPIVVTEFGVFPRGGVENGAGLPEHRAESFRRVLTGLVANATEYDIAGVFAFTLQGPEGDSSEEGGEAGDFDLIEPVDDAYRLTGLGERYRDLVAAPETMAFTVKTPGSSAPLHPSGSFTGSGERGAQVRVIDDAGAVLCEATVSPTSTWSCAPAKPMRPGEHLAEVETSVGDTAVIVPLAYIVTAAMTSPAHDGTGPVGFTPFSGVGRPGASIAVVGTSGTQLCATRVAPDGTWACVSGKSLGAGAYTVYLHQGEEPPVEARFVLYAAAPVSSTTPEGSLSTTPTFSGRGDPGAAISVVGTSGRVLATTTVLPDGVWSTTSAVALPVAQYTVTAKQLATTGARSEAPITFTVVRGLVVTAPASGSTVTTHEPTFSGTGQIGATIEIRGQGTGRLLGTTVVGTDARWSVATLALPNDRYTVNVVQRASGVTVTIPVAFTVAA